MTELQERIDFLHKLGCSNNTNNNNTPASNVNEKENETKNDTEEEENQTDSNQTDSNHQSMFEENLMKLNTEWNEAVQGIELMCVQNEETANKWWDFARLKKKVVRWIEKKERDAKDNEEGRESYESILKNKDKYKVRDILLNLVHEKQFTR